MKAWIVGWLAFLGMVAAMVGSDYTTIVGYSGSNVVYVCEALPNVTTGQRAATKVAISAISKANPAEITSASHGFYFNSAGSTSPRPKVTISGATGTGWTGINATWTATITGANTFTVPIDSSGFGTLGGTVVFTTTAPRTSMYEWRVSKFEYATNSLVWSGFLNSSNGFNQRCSDAISTTLNQQ